METQKEHHIDLEKWISLCCMSNLSMY